MIEQIFAATELGIGAVEVSGGKATISTKVSHFRRQPGGSVSSDQCQSAGFGPHSNAVRWNGVRARLAYEILKRKIGSERSRSQTANANLADGDDSTTGFRHVALLTEIRFRMKTKARVHEVFAPAGSTICFDTNMSSVRSASIQPDNSASRICQARLVRPRRAGFDRANRFGDLEYFFANGVLRV